MEDFAENVYEMLHAIISEGTALEWFERHTTKLLDYSAFITNFHPIAASIGWNDCRTIQKP